ncbi:hypothetical protein OAL10_11605 [Gammaproteobacteria bacterium]|nr:hypothetical protein [Gammaproteobacteria bacterium]
MPERKSGVVVRKAYGLGVLAMAVPVRWKDFLRLPGQLQNLRV